MKKKILSIILSALITASLATSLSGCGCENKDISNTTETKSETSIVSDKETEPVTLNETEQAIADSGLTVDKDGNITDSKGNKVKTTEDGKVEVKTADGKTVKVDVSEVKSVTETKTNSNSSSNSATNKTSSNTSSSKAQNSSSSKTSSSNSSSSNGSSSKTSSNSSSSSANNSSSSAQSSKTYHEAVYKTVEHPAEYKDVWVVDIAAHTEEEPIYEKQGRYICNDCGADITDGDLMKQHFFMAVNNENGHTKGSYKVVSMNIQVGTKTVEVPEQGHYEKQLVKEAWTEKVLVKEAGWY